MNHPTQHFKLSAKQIAAIKNGAIILAQTDTTAGFLSTDLAALNAAKQRNPNQPCIKTFASLQSSKTYMRLGQIAKNTARKARKLSLASGDKSFRIITNSQHARLLKALEAQGICGIYSSSANAHGLEFCLDYAIAKAQFVALEDRLISAQFADASKLTKQFFQAPASQMLKFSRSKKFKIR